MRLALIAVAGVGCWSASQPAWVAPPIVAEEAPLPECPVQIARNGHLLVWEADLGEVAPAVAETDGRRAVVYQTGSEAYVALRDGEGKGGSTLWKVSCDGKKLDTIEVAGADFADAALHPDRRRLFYSHGAVVALDLVRRTHTKVTVPGHSAKCGELRDIVRGATRDHVELERGGACGEGGAYQGTLMRKHLASGREETALPITALVVNDGMIWLAAGECGNAAIFRSSDWRSWKKLAVPNLRGRITLVAGAPKTVMMATGLCSGTAGGHPAQITRDGGATWLPISKPVVEWVHGSELANARGGAANGRVLQWSNGELVPRPKGDDWRAVPALPEIMIVEGREVRPTRFGLYDAETDERLFPR